MLKEKTGGIRGKIIISFSIINSLIFIMAILFFYQTATRNMENLSEGLSENIIESKAENLSGLIDRKFAELNAIVEYEGIKNMNINLLII